MKMQIVVFCSAKYILLIVVYFVYMFLYINILILGILYAFDAFYCIDLTCMILFKRTDWTEVSHLYKPRNSGVLLIEALTLVPIDIVYYHLSRHKLELTLTYLRLRYIFRIIRVLADKREPPAMTKANTLLKLLVNFILIVTLTAFTIACIAHPYTCGVTSPDENCSMLSSYYLNLYVAVERISGKGFGETAQHHHYKSNIVLHFAGTTISFLAYFILAYTTSKLVCNLISKDTQMFSFMRDVSTIRRTILLWKQHNRSVWRNYHESLYNTCLSFYITIWEKRKCSLSRHLVEKNIPKIMFKEIYLDISWAAFKHSHVFRNEETHLLRKVAELMQHKFYAPGEVLFKQHVNKEAMMYVTTGIIQILSEENGETPILSLSAGTCIGESTLFISYPSNWTVVCKTYCEIEVLQKKDFVKLSAIYPEKYKQMTRSIRKRHLKAVHLQKVLRYQWKKLNVENPETITMMFVKHTLRETQSPSEVENDESEWDRRYAFYLYFFDMYVITEKMELTTDSIFLKRGFPRIFHPTSIFLDGWHISIAALTLAFAFFYPLYVFYCGAINGATHFLIYISISCLWLTDLYIQMSTAVKTKKVSLTTISSITYYKLRKGYLLIDIIVLLPVAFFLLLIKGKITYQSFVISELHKLLKLYKLKYLFIKIERLDLMNTITLRYMKCFIASFFLFFYTAMIFYTLVCDDDGCSLAYLEHLTKYTKLNVTNKQHQIIHFYAMASLFLADISYTDFLRIIKLYANRIVISIIVQLVYTFLNIFIIAFMAIVETLKESEWHRYKEYLLSMQNMAEDFNLSTVNRKRIEFYLKTHYWVDKGVMVLNPTLFSDNMSPNLYALYRRVLYGRFLHHLPLFAGLSESIIMDAISLIKVKNFPSGEVITYAGEVCKEMHVIEYGYCSMRRCRSSTVLKRGDSFCVIETCMQIPTFYTVTTVTDCTILSLDYTGCSQIANKYEEFKEIMGDTLREVIEKHDFGNTFRACQIVYDEDFGFDLDKKDVSFRKFIYSKERRIEKMTQFDTEFVGVKGPFKYLLLRYTFVSHGRFLFAWEMSRCTFAFLTNILTSTTKLCTNCATFYILVALDITAWADLYIRHHVCYFNELGVEVSHPMWTAVYYWKHSFLLDLIAVLPIDYFAADELKMYLRMNRVLQLHRVFRFTKHVNDNNITRSGLFEIIKYLPLTLLLVNYVSSVNLNMTCDVIKDNITVVNYSCAATRWRDVQFYHYGSENLRVQTHVAALLLTTTSLALIGFSKVQIEHTLELCTFSIMILIGHMFFVWITARMVADNFYSKSDLTSYQEAMKELLKFVNYRKVDKKIKKEIINHFEFMWLKTKGKDLKTLLYSFNTALKEDILFDIFGKNMQQSSIFPSASKSFFKSLLLEAKYEVFIHQGIIYRVNDIHGNLYFILKGNVDVLGPDYNKLLVLSTGSMFGNLDNYPMTRQTLMMVAKGNVELLRLTSTYFHTVLSKYPGIHSNFKSLTAFNVDYLENWSVLYNTQVTTLDDLIKHASVTTRTSAMERLSGWYYKLTKVFEETVYMRAWRLFILIVVCYIGFIMTMYHLTISMPSYSGLAVAYALDVFYLIYIYLEFHTSYKDEFGVSVKDNRMIAKHYLKRRFGFYWDLVAALPIEFVSLFAINKNYIWMIWARSRVNRAVRVVHVLNALKTTKEKIHINIIIMRILYIICWISIILLVLTAILYLFLEADAITMYNQSYTEIDKLSILADTYAIIVAVSSGAAMVTENLYFTTYSALCVVFMMLIFRFLITIFIAEICATLEAINQTKTSYMQFAIGLKQYMKTEGVSVPLRKRIGQYVNLLWIFHRGVQLPALLHQAPYYLREAILNAMFGFHLRRHPLLSHFHVDLIRQMAAEFNVLVFFPANYIIYEGDKDQCMYFIHIGEVEIISEDTLRTEVVKETLVTGDVFGLEQGLFGRIGHPYTYKVSKYSIIVALERSRWIKLLKFFPASETIINERYNNK